MRLFRKLILSLALVLPGPVFSDPPADSVPDSALSPEAEELAQALLELERQPSGRLNQIRFLQRFPSTHRGFIALFHPPGFGQLYSGSYRYIARLGSLRELYPQRVGALLIEIGREAHWDADAPGFIQCELSAFALDQTTVFLSLMKDLDADGRAGVISFLTDGLHSPACDFERLLDRLREAGATDLAKDLRTGAIEAAARQTHEGGPKILGIALGETTLQEAVLRLGRPASAPEHGSLDESLIPGTARVLSWRRDFEVGRRYEAIVTARIEAGSAVVTTVELELSQDEVGRGPGLPTIAEVRHWAGAGGLLATARFDGPELKCLDPEGEVRVLIVPGLGLEASVETDSEDRVARLSFSLERWYWGIPKACPDLDE